MRDSGSASARGFVFTTMVLLTCMAMSLAAQLPAGVGLELARSHSRAFERLWPQHWSFFASAPEWERVAVYRSRPGGAPLELAMSPRMSERNLWGIGRVAAAQLVEVSYLARRIPSTQWHKCESRIGVDCRTAASLAPPFAVVNDFPGATLCGPLVLARERAGTGTSGGAGIQTRTPVEVTFGQVTCIK